MTDKLTDEKVVQLARKHRISGSDGALAAIREAYDVGRRDGLEEAAHIADCEAREFHGSMHDASVAFDSGWDGCAEQIGKEIRKLLPAPPAAISCSDSTAVEAARKDKENSL